MRPLCLRRLVVSGALLLGTLSLHGVAAWRALGVALAKRRAPWVLVTLALALVALWQLGSLYDHFVRDTPVNVAGELWSSAVAVLALVGIGGMQRQERVRSESEQRLSQVVRRLTAELAAERQRYDATAAGAGLGLWDWNVDEGRVQYSPEFAEMLGAAPGELAPELSAWLDRIVAEDVPVFRTRLLDHLSGKTPGFECEYRVMVGPATERHFRARGLAIREPSGRAVRVAGSQLDLTDQRRTEQRLTHGALHDSLTGLPNRALLSDRLARCAALAERRGRKFAILAIDLDRLHAVNESFGRDSGDELLMDVARKLHQCARPGDTVARVDGDQFVILLEDVDGVREARQIAERIQAELAVGTNLRGQDVVITASIGIATSDRTRQRSPEELLRAADASMYRAKGLGGARVEEFRELKPTGSGRARLALETELRRAITRDQIDVAYQPIVSLETGRIGGFEALARWHNSERGSIPPSEFVPIAERAGMLSELERRVLAQAARDLGQWQRVLDLDVPLEVAVNVSPRRFLEDDLLDEVESAIRDNALAPGTLKLEITEGTLLECDKSSKARLERLRQLGVRLVIDDFGTGYSSFQYLHELPLDTLKIDQSFVRELGSGARGEVVRTIIALARHLGLEAVAEGVETAEQLACLRGFGCNWAQGYFFAKAVPARDALALVQREVEVLDATRISGRIRVQARNAG